MEMNLKVTKACSKDISDNMCSGDECKNKVKFRWSGGFFYCKVHHLEELESYITSDEEDSGEEESEGDDEDLKEESKDENKKKNVTLNMKKNNPRIFKKQHLKTIDK